MTSAQDTSGLGYRHALRIIGRYLNQRKARVISLGDIEGGYLLQFAAEGRFDRFEGFALHRDDLMDLEHIFRTRRADSGRSGVFAGLQSFFGFRRDEGLAFQKSHPLCPQGYEEVLRSLGAQLDALKAHHVVIAEMSDQMVMEYSLPGYGYAAGASHVLAPFEMHTETYTRSALEQLITRERHGAVQALADAPERLRQDPNDPQLYLEVGRLFQDEGNFARAAELYRTALSLEPQDGEAAYRLAELSVEQAQHREALDWVTMALSLNPESSRYHDLLGKICLLLGQRDRARAAFERAVALAPANRTYQLHLSQVAPDTALPSIQPLPGPGYAAPRPTLRSGGGLSDLSPLWYTQALPENLNQGRRGRVIHRIQASQTALSRALRARGRGPSGPSGPLGQPNQEHGPLHRIAVEGSEQTDDAQPPPSGPNPPPS